MNHVVLFIPSISSDRIRAISGHFSGDEERGWIKASCAVMICRTAIHSYQVPDSGKDNANRCSRNGPVPEEGDFNFS
jgi:hypothetical protein